MSKRKRMEQFLIPSPILAAATVVLILLFGIQVMASHGGVEPDTGFEVEGNLALDGLAQYDWENAIAPNLILDPHSKDITDPNIFKPAGKFDDPANWSILPGTVGSAQTELTNILAWALPPGELGMGRPMDSWLILGMERTKKEGTFALDFELNQQGWDGQSGTLIRTKGDVAVGFELSGNPNEPEEDLQVLIVVYDPLLELDNDLCTVIPGQGQSFTVERGASACPAYGASGWYYRFLADAAILSGSGYGVATMNDVGFPVSDGAPPGYISYTAQGNLDGTVGPFELAEAAINLTELGLDPGCPGFGTVHAKSRSSLEVGSDLKDLAGPQALPVRCKLEGCKYLDEDGNGDREAGEPGLAGWEIELNGLTDEGQPVSFSTFTDAAGCYLFEDLSDGSYSVNEICPAGAGWVQTDPGFTSFAGCGNAEYTGIDVNLDNRIVTGLDFGNGRPAIDISKTCTDDVFQGDDIEYEFVVTNVGNVDLTNITVSDTLLGEVGTIATLAVGDSQTLTALFTTTASGPLPNTATASGFYGTQPVSVSDSADCTSDVWALAVTKDAATTFTRTYNWVIQKVVDNPGPILLPGGQNVTVNYTVSVDLVGITDSDWAVSGNITISNFSPLVAGLEAVTDLVSPDIAATVDCPSMTIPPGGELVCTYSAPLPDGSARINTATAVLNLGRGGTFDFSGVAAVDFAGATISHVDEQIVVTDSYAGFLGTADALVDTLPKSFTYSRTLTSPIDFCGEFTVDNVGNFTTNDTGTMGSDDAGVIVQSPCEGCTPGFWQGGSGSLLWDVVDDPDWPLSGGQGTNPYVQTTLFNDFFEPHGPAAGFTMYDLVSTGGGADNWQKATRSTVAAYLNASWGMLFPYTPDEISAMWADAVNSGDFLALHLLLSGANDPTNGYCPAG